MLEGIRLPKAQHLAQARSLLDALVRKGPVTFAATPPKQDRYGRLRAQGFAEVWLQIALLERGLAQVALSPDRDECFPELYEAEALARERGLGLWTDSAYRPRHPQTVMDTGGFYLVEGRIASVRRQEGRSILSFEGGRGVAGVVAADDRRTFRDFDLEGLEARRVRIRGVVQDNHGRQEIWLFNPAQIEVLER
jgi:hypothetical protein